MDFSLRFAVITTPILIHSVLTTPIHMTNLLANEKKNTCL